MTRDLIDVGLCFFVLIILIVGQRAAYRNGVSDGAYNQWLPHVREIVKEDSKFPPPGWEEPTP